MAIIQKIQKFLHDKLGWGFPNKSISGDGYQPTYSCRFCDEEIAKDSQGNWFHLSISK